MVPRHKKAQLVPGLKQSPRKSSICSAGAEIKVSKPLEDKNPLVLGRLGRNPNVPTVTFYGHYDVQPAMEREWATDPFEIAAIDGYLYGRGTSDNKVNMTLLAADPQSTASLHVRHCQARLSIITMSQMG